MRSRNNPGGELAFIEKLRHQELQAVEKRRATGIRNFGRVRLGIGDDCAILSPLPGHEVLVTTDLCLEGRHFRRDWHPPESAGHRSLARGLSDLAAMGAQPLAAFLSLAIPSGLPKHWLDRFLAGFRSLAEEARVSLAGGDTAQSPSEHLLADIVLVGSAPVGKALRRSTALPGDLLYVTGSLGGAAAELLTLQSQSATTRNPATPRPGRPGLHPQLFPSPRLAIGATLLRRHLATACIDMSDGLSTDLKHLCDASKLSAELDLASLPIHPLASGNPRLALHGGEDYELLFAAKPSTRMPRSIAGVAITRIGAFTTRSANPVITGIDSDGTRSPLAAGGWEHTIG